MIVNSGIWGTYIIMQKIPSSVKGDRDIYYFIRPEIFVEYMDSCTSYPRTF